MSTESQRDRERELEQLFAHAEPRAAPPPADEAFIREAVYAEWNELMGRRVRVRRFRMAAAAAAVASIAVVVATSVYRPPAAPLLATVERSVGQVQIVSADGATPAARGARVHAGALLATGDGQTALRLAGNGSLRLAPGTQLRMLAPAEAELVAGLLYFDSESSSAALTIRTPQGDVRDVGTQFYTRVADDRLEIGVRDGRVAVAHDGDRSEVGAGEKLTVPDGAAVRRETLPTYGAEWAWAERLAPPFEIDGRTLNEFLLWVAAQTGRDLVFSDSAAERVARIEVMRGSIDLEPLPKLDAVLATTDLSYTLDGGTIRVSSR